MATMQNRKLRAYFVKTLGLETVKRLEAGSVVFVSIRGELASGKTSLKKLLKATFKNVKVLVEGEDYEAAVHTVLESISKPKKDFIQSLTQ